MIIWLPLFSNDLALDSTVMACGSLGYISTVMSRARVQATYSFRWVSS
jgi:hypothetical protein